jgi:hypothetical protein
MKDWILTTVLAGGLGLGWGFVTRSAAVGWGIGVTVMIVTLRARSDESRVQGAMIVGLVWAVAHLFMRSQ